MTINRDNYELFFIDYFDGNLNDQQVDELLHFLKDNADLEEEFYAFENINITNEDHLTYNQQPSLLKSVNDLTTITAKNFDEFCVAYIENDLNEQNKAKFEMFLAENVSYQQEFEKYKHTKLPVEIVPFPNKNKLKKYTGRVLFLQRTIRIAAAASFISACLLFFRYDQEQQIMIAETPVETEYVTYDNTPALIADNEENKTPESSDSKDENNKIVQKKKPTVKPASEKKTTPEKKPENIVAPKEQLKPVQKKGIFIVKNEWQKPLIPNTNFNSLNAEQELETLMAEAPNTSIGNELTIEKVKALLNDNKRIADISVWELADMGLRQFGKMTESEYSVKPIISNEGKLESVAFTTEKYTLFAPMRRNR